MMSPIPMTHLNLTEEQHLNMPYLLPPEPIPCEICTYPSHGYHFKVMSCRACAAFFRRSLLARLRYICKGRMNDCPIDSTVRYFCKLCRFQKCLKAGMNADKIQQNRDPISSKVPGTSNDFEAPSIDESVKKSMFNGPLYDFQTFIAEIRQIFSDKENFDEKLPPLRELEKGLKFIRRNQKRIDLKILEEINFEIITETRLNVIKTSATWLMYSEFFRELSEKEKMLILKTTWHVWGRLELLTVSVEILGEKVSREKVVFVSKSHAVYLVEVFRNNLMELDPKEAEDVDKELQPLFFTVFDDVAKKLSILKPNLIEQAYLLWQMIWCVAGKILYESHLEAGEQFLNSLSSDLHDFYKNDLRIVKYSERLLQMMSVIRSMQKTYIDIHRVIDHAHSFRQDFVMK
ncbi:Protein CBR-NHR-218 [Caenorhabditis briggsae]|uniref:Protein CBR-NHR-218 n=2 Tax=Caenorhabditis briggsae TaxID=6238 RepID=A8XMZ8_CAEBR|nr:Protein CBR-NHR-218 [Caenorhabditis briggsae]UMM37759.1 hypothetical protein L5515_009425 [Caenorhabditis briggsae]CAP34024.1 Protein CBR-NHR-218 [Caenorhabditis briggsae]